MDREELKGEIDSLESMIHELFDNIEQSGIAEPQALGGAKSHMAHAFNSVHKAIKTETK